MERMESCSVVGTEVPIIDSVAVKLIDVYVQGYDAVPNQERDDSTPSVLVPPLKDDAYCSVFGTPPVYLIWRFRTSFPNALEVLEICANEDVLGTGLRIHFPEALFPFACLCQNEFNDAEWGCPYLLYTMSVSGVAYCVLLKSISYYTSRPEIPAVEFIQYDLQNFEPRARLCAVTAIAGYLVIGREDGSATSYRICSFHENDPGLLNEMRIDAVVDRLWSYFYGVRVAACVKALKIAPLNDREKLVFLLHTDGFLRIWDLFGGEFIYYLSLPGTSAENLWLGEATIGTSIIRLAILLKEALLPLIGPLTYADRASRPMVGSKRICICELNFARKENITFSLDYLPSFEEELIDVKLSSNKIWVLKEDQLSLLSKPPRKQWEGRCYTLQDAFVAEQLFQTSKHNFEDLLQLACSIFSSQKAEAVPFLSSIFLHRLLHPVVHNSYALRNVFEQYGKHWTDAEFQAFTVDGLRREILSLIEHEAISESLFSILQCWKVFCSRYVESWRKRNASYGLIVDCRTGAIGTIREDSLSLFRNLDRIELLSYGSLTNPDELTKVGLIMPVNLGFELLLGLLRCNRLLSQRLGGAVSHILYEALVSCSVVQFDDIVPILLKMLQSGSNLCGAALHVPAVGADVVRQKQMAENKNLRRFSVEMLLSLQALQRKANGWGSLLDVIVRYLDLLVPTVDQKNLTSKMPANIITSVVVQATSQVAKAMFESALDLLFLLHYILNIRGQINLFEREITRIQLDLIPSVYELCMDWLIIYFVATTPSESDATEDLRSQLSSLQIDGSIAKASWTEKLGSFGYTAAFVLSMNADGQSSQPVGPLSGPEDFVSLVQNFCGWILCGGPGEDFFSIFDHSANLALILMKHTQYNAAKAILQFTISHLRKVKSSGTSIKQANRKWSLLHHLLGCCLVAQAHDEPNGVLREKKISKAVRCFFKASYGEEAAHTLQELPCEAGFAHLGFNGCESAASWRLHYYQWTMQMFEQYNMSQAACQFAHSALEQVDEAVSQNDNASEDALSGESRITIKGRLWANVFKFMLDLNEFYDAYCATVSNPDEESKNICLRRLIIVLYECGAKKMLCNGQLPFIGLTEKVERELAWKAACSNIVAKPNPFELLYAFETHRQNWRKAARYMYLFSDKLKTEIVLGRTLNSTLLIQERLNAISAAMNALQLLPPEHAWIDLQIEGDHFHNDLNLNKNARMSEDQSASVETQSPGSLTFVSMEKLEDEFVLTSAEHLLSSENVTWSRSGNQMPPFDIVDHLVQAELYDMAFTVLLRFCKGFGFNKGLESVFSALSLKCSPDHSKRNSRWEVLENYIEKYKIFHPRLPVVVAETLLRSDSQIELPLWLVHMFKCEHKKGGFGMGGQESGPASLLCLYVDYGRYTEATDLLIEYLEAYKSVRPEDLVRRKSPFAACFPYITIERLWCKLEASVSAGFMDKQCGKLKTLIHGALQGHLNLVYRIAVVQFYFILHKCFGY